MTVPEETDCEVQDWICTFLERKNQNQKSAGSGGVFSLPRKKEGRKWNDITAQWRGGSSEVPTPIFRLSLLSLEPTWPPGILSKQPRVQVSGPGESWKGCSFWGNIWDMMRSSPPQGSFCLLHVCLPGSYEQRRKKGEKKIKKHPATKWEKKGAKKSFARRNFIWLPLKLIFSSFAYSFLCTPWASLKGHLFH